MLYLWTGTDRKNWFLLQELTRFIQNTGRPQSGVLEPIPRYSYKIDNRRRKDNMSSYWMVPKNRFQGESEQWLETMRRPFPSNTNFSCTPWVTFYEDDRDYLDIRWFNRKLIVLWTLWTHMCCPLFFFFKSGNITGLVRVNGCMSQMLMKSVWYSFWLVSLRAKRLPVKDF